MKDAAPTIAYPPIDFLFVMIIFVYVNLKRSVYTWHDWEHSGSDSKSSWEPKMHSFTDDSAECGTRFKNGNQSSRRYWKCVGHYG